MKILCKWLNSECNFIKAFHWAVATGSLTILLVMCITKSGNQQILSFGNFLGGIGNDIFLISSNLLIIAWAWSRRLRSIITLTLGLDAVVWAGVQGIKLLKISPWYLRPNGGTGGFPSGHATHAFAMALLLTLFFPRLAWFWYACAAAISWSRVETDWHTGFQVAAGVILGISIACLFAGKWLKHPEAVTIQPAAKEERQTVSAQQAFAIK
jgi:membrane-associated phospholipid phosphatase